MNHQTLVEILQDLRDQPTETEVCEFKEAKHSFDFSKLGKYFSALSNEANLKVKPWAWLIFGIENRSHQIVGSLFRSERKDLDSLKEEIANKTTNRITFQEIHELILPEGRVVMFQIPAAPRGIPIAFEGHYYGREGEALSPLNIEEIERIRAGGTGEDWSAGIIAGAGLEDLDPKAIEVARQNYRVKFPSKIDEMEQWDDKTFLNKAKLTIKDKITRTAIILLGREEAEHFLSPAVAKIRWILKDDRGVERDYLILSCPFLLAVDEIYNKIRNLKYRYLKEGTLFPEEVDQYAPYTIREALNNAIAHQDYQKQGRINVVEMEDQLIFSNLGEFIPGSVEKVVIEDAPEEQYRNRFLVTAMFNLNMVDTIGGGIRKMFQYQSVRLFPMPEYDLKNGRVKLTITGKILDIDFARTLARNQDLNLAEIMLLDKVAKKKQLADQEAKYLRNRKLIEGRKPNYFLSQNIAQRVGKKAAYSKNKAFDKEYYLDLILKAIEQHQFVDRRDVDELLWNKLPDWMSDEQRKTKINNLLSELRREQRITNQGSARKPIWVLIN